MPDMTNAEAAKVLNYLIDKHFLEDDWREAFKTALTALTPKAVNGETSDGYHTFNELYHHRALLFSVIVNLFQARSWKSKQHDDGTMFNGMFIVGIETPEGQATYHYNIEPYWKLFDCCEYERAPKWDGHTPNDAIERIARLGLRRDA